MTVIRLRRAALCLAASQDRLKCLLHKGRGLREEHHVVAGFKRFQEIGPA